MQSKLLRILTVFFWAALLFSCDRQEVRLRFAFHAGDETRYEMRSRLRMIVGSDSLSSFGSEYLALVRRKVETVYSDGSARLKLSMDSLSYNSSGRSQEECRHVETYLGRQEFRLKMDPRGEILEAETGAILPELENSGVDLTRLMLKIQPILPGGNISVGQKWERQQKSGSYIYKWFHFEELQEKDGRLLAKIRVNLKLRMDESAGSRIRFSSEDFLLGSGDLFFDVESGDLVSGSLEITGLVNANIRSSGQQLSRLRVRQIIDLRRVD